MTAREILGMDQDGQMAIGIQALQRLLHTLKDYKIKLKHAEATIISKTTDIEQLQDMIERQRIHIDTQNSEIIRLEDTTLKLKCIDSIDLTDL
jgi:hypothetical protein